MKSAGPSYSGALWRDLLRYLPAVIAPSVVGLLLLPLLTSAFSVTAYGDYATALVVYSLLDALAVSWYGSTVIRFYPGSATESDTQYLQGTLFGLSLAVCASVAFASLIIILLLRPLLSTDLFSALLLTPLLLLASGALELPLNILRAQRRIGAYNWLIIANNALGPIAGLLVGLRMGGSAFGLLLGVTLLTWALVLPAYAICFGRALLPNLAGFKRDIAANLLSFGLPLIPSVLLITALSLSDRLIIGAFRGAAETGVYAVGYDLASFPLMLVYGLAIRAAAPLIVAAWEQNGREAAENLQTLITRAYFLVGVPAMLGLGALANSIMAALVAKDFSAGASVAWFVASGTFVFGLQLIAQRGMILAKKTGKIMLAFFAAGLLNVGANLLLVPRFGFIAAAWTTLAAYLLLLVLIAKGSAPYLTWRIPWPTLKRVFIAGLLLLVALELLPEPLLTPPILNLALKVVIGALVYGAALLLLGERVLADHE